MEYNYVTSREYWEVCYYKQLRGKWLKGRVRNLSQQEAFRYLTILSELFDTKLVKMRKQ